MNTHAYSVNGEGYSFLEIYDAIDYLIGGMETLPEVGTIFTIYQGEVAYYNTDHYIPKNVADRMVDDLRENAYSEIGEFANNWLSDCSITQLARLDSMLHSAITEWVEMYNFQPNFGIVEHTKPIQVKITEISEYSFEYTEI